MSRMLGWWLAFLMLAAVLLPSSSLAKQPPRLGIQAPAIYGRAIYQGRTALPPGCVLEVRLVEVSRANDRGRTLARAVRSSPRQFPIAFEIPYDLDRLEARRSYEVRASLTVGNWVRYSGTAQYAASRRGHGVVTVEMRRLDGEGEGRGEGRDEDRDRVRGLEDARWVAVRVADRSVPSMGGSRETWMVLDSRTGRASGSGGCNRMSASYEAAFGRLRFGEIAATRMACSEMRTETAFFRALERTRRYSLSGRRLQLMDANGTVLAVFEERVRR